MNLNSNDSASLTHNASLHRHANTLQLKGKWGHFVPTSVSLRLQDVPPRARRPKDSRMGNLLVEKIDAMGTSLLNPPPDTMP